ncbi:unnamed protein product [Effrenium voratum]|nr:unnamed protein product [Effrenium voratum]
MKLLSFGSRPLMAPTRLKMSQPGSKGLHCLSDGQNGIYSSICEEDARYLILEWSQHTCYFAVEAKSEARNRTYNCDSVYVQSRLGWMLPGFSTQSPSVHDCSECAHSARSAGRVQFHRRTVRKAE